MCDIRKSNPDSTSIFDALSFKTQTKTVPLQQEVVVEQIPEQTQIAPQDIVSEQPNKGNVPANNMDFSEEDELLPLAVIDENQQFSSDPDMLQPLDPNAIGQIPEEKSEYKAETSKDHSTNKMLSHAWIAGIEYFGLGTKFATGIVKRATTKAVGEELTKIIAKKATASATKVTTATLTKTVEKAAEIGVGKTVTKLTGNGVATVGLIEGAKAAGNIFKGVKESGKLAREIILKDGVTKVISNTSSALVKTGIGSGEKVLQAGLEQGTKIAVEKALETTTKGLAKGSQKVTASAITKATNKATTEVAAKGSTKFATGLGKALPWISTGIGVAITAWDANDAWKKQKDPNASAWSAGLAWATVGLDVFSTVSSATGVGKPFGWVATGLSIGTSIASDYLR